MGEPLLKLQNIILEMIASGRPIGEITDRLCGEVEGLLPDVECAVMTADRGGVLHLLSALKLPDGFSGALSGVQSGPDTAAEGRAAFFRRPAAAGLVADHTAEAGAADEPAQLSYEACWSSPFHGSDGEVLGTVCLYFRERRGPTQREQEVVAGCLRLCELALERDAWAREHERLAFTDSLTDLGNRARFRRDLGSLPCETAAAWALLVVDLDNLKVVNDTFGHAVGDRFLQIVAARIEDSVRPERAYRLGGDEFAVVLTRPESIADIEGVAQAILAALAAPTPDWDHPIGPKATIGGAILSDDDEIYETVRQNADVALYHAKETSRGGFVLHRQGIGTRMTRRVGSVRDVSAALREARIDAYYQPVVRLDTGEVVGAEALCRMITPSGEVVSAQAFHEALRDAQVASAVTSRMVSVVAADLRRWLEAGIPFQHIGINVSSADLYGGKLLAQLQDAFDAQGLSLDHLILEVTEDVYLERGDYAVAEQIRALRDHGLRIALDDFGTGFASLTHLRTIPMDIIKIDKSFVDGIIADRASRVIVDGLIAVAAKLGIRVVAEGIETEEQRATLREAGCSLGQGFLFSRAVDRAEMTRMLFARAQSVPLAASAAVPWGYSPARRAG